MAGAIVARLLASSILHPEREYVNNTGPLMSKSKTVTLAIDAMGADAGPLAVVEGAANAIAGGEAIDIAFYGRKEALAGPVSKFAVLQNARIVDCAYFVAMDDKPSQVVRRGRETSMWAAIEAVKAGDAQAVISGGNTGALMAMSKLQLRMIDGVDRPAITALWPTPRGRSVVLDVGANVEADADQLVQFAIMGEAFFRAMTSVAKPSVGLLNVGAEELKGHDLIRAAARILREADPEMAFSGFVEGDDISKGTVDVVVTDGFSGNIALKSAEGAARLVGRWMKESLTGSLLSRFGALMMARELHRLKSRIDPSSANGGVFLGLNGTVVKSHGGADAKGVASAISMAANLARQPFHDEIASTIARVRERAERGLDGAPRSLAANTDETGPVKAAL